MTEQEYKKNWYQKHKEEVKARSKIYYSEHKEEQLVKNKVRYEKNKERYLQQQKEYRESNKVSISEKNKNYYYTQTARANNLVRKYKEYDILHDKGECTLTSNWIKENIFTSSCVYCGDSDWTHLGADRVNNELPHTPENVVCSCGICNAERSNLYSVEEFRRYRQYHPRFIDIQERQRKGFLKG